MKLEKIEDLVKKILEEYPDSRTSDDVLVFRVYKEINEDAMVRELFCEVLLNRKQYNLPSYKSIERCRRKIFAKYPELKPKKVTEFREQKEEEYREYSRI